MQGGETQSLEGPDLAFKTEKKEGGRGMWVVSRSWYSPVHSQQRPGGPVKAVSKEQTSLRACRKDGPTARAQNHEIMCYSRNREGVHCGKGTGGYLLQHY